MLIARDIVIDVFAYRGQVVPQLRGWLTRTAAAGYEVREVYCRHNIDIERNRSVRQFLERDAPRGAQHLLMLDADMVPVEETQAILSEDGDLLYCGYRGQGGRFGHYGDGDLGCGCVRMSAKLLRAVSPPWFAFAYSADGSERTACECHDFRDKARAAGFESRMVGVIGHVVEAIVLPKGEARGRFSMKWAG